MKTIMYENLLKKSKLQSLKIRRLRTIAVEHSKLSINKVQAIFMT